jgi:hypothetical protein
MANPTTNYSFAMPTNVDLVKDLPADFDIFGQAVDDRIKALNPETTTGDISYRSATANTNTRLAIGTAGQVLTVNSGATAPEWKTPSGGKVLQVVSATTTTQTSISSNSYTDSGLTASITPSLATSKVLIMVSSVSAIQSTTNQTNNGVRLMRGATSIGEFGDAAGLYTFSQIVGSSTSNEHRNVFNLSYLDSPSTTSSTTYKIQARTSATTDSRTIIFQHQNLVGSIILMEIGA